MSSTLLKNKLSQKNGAHSTVYLINGDKYSGEWKDNQKEGKGTYYYKKSGNQYHGEWKQEMRHGYGTLSVPSNVSNVSSTSASSGEKINLSSSQESLKLRKIYTGSWDSDYRSGLGTYFYTDGSIYEGQWIQDMKQGWGRMNYADGSVYEGEWHHEMRHGQGVLLLANGDRYEGMWFDDKKEGPGKFIYLKKRQCYVGEWSLGQPRCGSIQNLTAIPGFPGTMYAIPPIGLEDHKNILDIERTNLQLERARRLV